MKLSPDIHVSLFLVLSILKSVTVKFKWFPFWSFWVDLRNTQEVWVDPKIHGPQIFDHEVCGEIIRKTKLNTNLFGSLINMLVNFPPKKVMILPLNCSFHPQIRHIFCWCPRSQVGEVRFRFHPSFPSPRYGWISTIFPFQQTAECILYIYMCTHLILV